MIKTIFSQLIYNGAFFTNVWPHLKADYFTEDEEKLIYKLIKKHVDEYSNIPTPTALQIALDKERGNQTTYEGAKTLLDSLENTPEDLDWLMKETEKFIRDRAMYNAMSRALEIQANAQLPKEKQNKKLPGEGAIPEIMQEALSITFDSDVGHDWFNDFEKRFLLYQTKANKIPFKLPMLNKITKGGAERKTLNVLLAGVNVGKSLGLCSLAADYMECGYDVLYISMEMAEHVVAKRIDANLLDLTLDELDSGNVSFAEYSARMKRVKNKKIGDRPVGKLMIKQYPTGGANSNHFEALMNELRLKKQFKPDVVIVDYLGICASSRLRVYSENSYTLVKAIAEELRGFFVKWDVVGWTAAQTTRAGWDASDLNMSDTAESAGLPATADFMLGVIETEDLAKMGVQLMKQIKSRYGDKNYYSRFNVGVKKGNQRWYEVPNQIADQENAQVKPQSAQQAEKREKLDELANNMTF